MKTPILISTLAALLAFTSSATTVRAADEEVTLSGVHLCCKGCIKAVKKACADATCEIDDDAGTVKITGDEGSVKKALKAIGKGGLYGKSSSDKLAIPATKASKDKTDSVTIKGTHLCCKSCIKAVNKALADVDGCKGHDAKKGAKEFTVKGEVSPADIIAALHKVGLDGVVVEKK